MVSIDYGPEDRERFVPESHSSTRGDFQRDRGRIIHSSSFRRLSQKTQVLSPTAGVDFARNRLTHSLEVAQVGREIGGRLGLDPDVVDGACLAHDLGHPPFGHNGESAIAAWAKDIGGFEGNAQTFRALTRLESKLFDDSGRPRGLNLTRASLDAASKYPWPRAQAVLEGDGREKFGFYDDDHEVFDWLREGIPDRAVSLEAQVMDLADDIAYSVHDFEDAIVGGFIKPESLVGQESPLGTTAVGNNWSGSDVDSELMQDAFIRLRRLEQWPKAFAGTRSDFAQLKNFTSSMIGRFAHSVTLGNAERGSELPFRYRYRLNVPLDTVAEIAFLKGVVATAVMRHETRQPIYRHQREVLTDLLNGIWSDPVRCLEPVFQADFSSQDREDAQKRVVVDQVAALTDASALAWHERLHQY
ncbi:dGTP triphosphohydrolase [Pontimonas salivibrio]|uniref:Deoxyguanosinetriphosphate triphosphohydrolase-like protein n=1 Tax=Pontimonas salivibrio TaxID=1159327 RepID=A0A2L2BQ44_9MICO|nr:dGTP triphosphohydrolase [Pontimonas salivibrio]